MSAPRVEVTNNLSRVWGPRDFIRELDKLTSYPIEGAHFSPAFKAKVWDGREHCLRKSRKGDFWLVPTGLLPEVLETFTGIELVDGRRGIGDRLEFQWIGKELREYQHKAIASVLEDRGLFSGRGMLNLPIRSGKTMISAGLIQQTGLRTLFVVPSELLLRQTADAFKAALKPAPVGLFGDGMRDLNWITIATAQSLLAHPKVAAELLSEADLFIMDEAHHLEGPAWRNLALKSNSPLKVGLSATVFVSPLKQNDKASIWLKACTGPILHRVSMARLMSLGYLMRPRVLFYRFQHDEAGYNWNWQRVVKECLAQNRKRNSLICDLAAGAVSRKMRVLIDTGRHDQMKLLRDYLVARGVKVELVHGGTPSETRWKLIKAFQARKLPVLIGTVFGEGVDIPELEVVINAEGQKSQKAAIQRMRNLTPSEGKGEVLFVDFADIGQPYLQKHSKDRLNLYLGMRGFKVEACDARRPSRNPLALLDS